MNKLGIVLALLVTTVACVFAQSPVPSVAPPDSNAITLTLGSPYEGNITGNGAVTFKLDVTVASSAPIIIAVTSLTGDPDLYVSTNPNPRSSPTWSATSYGSDTVVIASDDPNRCQTNPCTYYITVYAWRQYCRFSLQASQGTASLTDGIPQSGTIPRRHSAKFTYVTPPGAEDHFEFTVQTTGHTHLYVSTSGMPTWGNSTWSSTTGNPVVVTARTGDPGFCDSGCTYYILLTAGYGTVNFTITASASNTVTTLSNGVTTYGSVQPRTYAYYQVSFGDDNDLSFSVSPIRGSFQFFISTATSHPTSENNIWPSPAVGRTTIISKNDPNYCAPGPSCVYYIGVLGSTRHAHTENFAITAQVLNDTVAIQAGVPAEGTVVRGQSAKFTFSANAPPSGHITFSAMATQGFAKMRVSTNGPATATNYQWLATGSNPLVVLARNGDVGWCAECTYYIELEPTSTTPYVYSLVAAAANETVTLRNGVPQYDGVEQGHYAYFKLSFEDPDDITITVSQISGDPDLYVSTINPQPTRSNYTWGSAFGPYSTDTVSIRTSDPNYVRGGTYYIGVYGYGNGINTFTITGSHAATVVELLNGVPQRGNAEIGDLAHYKLRVEGTAQNHVTFTVTPNTGRLQIYLGTTGVPVPGNTSTYQWVDVWGVPAVITANPGDTGFCFQCTYYLTVADTRASNVTFTVVGASSNISTTLTTGVPQVNEIPRGTFAYYKYYISKPQDVRIAITAEQGDPDVYVSRRNQWPSSADNDWFGSSWGGDSVTISTSDPKFCTSCTLYISVYAFTQVGFTRFSITASQGSDTLQLNDGEAQTGSLSSLNDARHYQMYVPAAVGGVEHVTFVVTPTSGNLALYVSTSEIPVPTNSSTYQWADTFGNPVVVSARANNNGFCSDCTYYLTVKEAGTSGGTALNYTIRGASSSTVPRLRIGTPVYDQVERNRYVSYQVYLQYQRDITFTLSALNGDPDMYISAKDRNPTRTTHQWHSLRYGSDSITISSTDSRLTIPGFIYISVYGPGTTSSYTLLASTENVVSQLIAGVPQSGTVLRNGIAYYSTRIADLARDHVSFSVTPTVGLPSLYVSRTGLPDPTNSSSYQWSSTYGNPVVVTIHAEDPNFCSSCRYYLGVAERSNSATPNVTYTVQASASNSTTILVPNSPLFDSVSAATYGYYSVVFTESGNITFDVQRYDGDPDICISTTVQAPKMPRDCTWQGNRFGGESILISTTDPNYKTGPSNPYYVSIYSFYSSSSFVITASQSHVNGTVQATPLLTNVVSSGYVDPNSNRLYKVRVDEDVGRVVFKVNPTDGGTPVMYISTSGPPNPAIATSYQWHADSGFPAVFTVATKQDAGFCVGCDYYILITNGLNSTHSNFTIEADTGTSLLQQGVGLFDAALYNDYTYYRIQPSQLSTGVRISVNPYLGQVQVYASFDMVEPRKGNTTWSQEYNSAGGSTLIIDSTDPNWSSDKPLFVSVYGLSACNVGTYPCFGDNATIPNNFIEYTITATSYTATSATSLRPGIPLSSQVAPQGEDRYILDTSSHPSWSNSVRFAILVQADLPVKLEASTKSWTDFTPVKSVDKYETPVVLVLPNTGDDTFYVKLKSRYTKPLAYTIRLFKTTTGKHAHGSIKNVLVEGQTTYGLVPCSPAGSTLYQTRSEIHGSSGTLKYVSLTKVGHESQKLGIYESDKRGKKASGTGTKHVGGGSGNSTVLAFAPQSDIAYVAVKCEDAGGQDYGTYSVSSRTGTQTVTLDRGLITADIARPNEWTAFNSFINYVKSAKLDIPYADYYSAPVDSPPEQGAMKKNVDLLQAASPAPAASPNAPAPATSPAAAASPKAATSPAAATSPVAAASPTPAAASPSTAASPAPPKKVPPMSTLCVVVIAAQTRASPPSFDLCKNTAPGKVVASSIDNGGKQLVYVASPSDSIVDVDYTNLIDVADTDTGPGVMFFVTTTAKEMVQFNIEIDVEDNSNIIDDPDDDGGKKKLGTGAIVGIVAGAIGFVLLIGVLVMVLKSKARTSSDKSSYNDGYSDLLRS